jgi:tetratricopeptide (TPR) repeat protein
MMATTAPRFRPNYLRTPDLLEICAHYLSAEAAFDAGNYYVALLKAEQSGDQETAALSRLMCGDYAGGIAGLEKLDQPSSRAARFQSLGHWIAGDKQAACAGLDKETDTPLIKLIGKDDIHLLIIFGPHTKNAVPDPAPDGYTLHTVCVERDEKAPALETILSGSTGIDGVIVFDVYGPRLPDEVFDIDAPVIFLTYDLDFQLHHQFGDLRRADLILMNAAFEHIRMDGIYPCPVAAYPAYINAFVEPGFTTPAAEKDIDILHTGLSFTPIMREKAQYLFRLASLDEPDLDIRIHHGFLDKDEYLEALSHAKFVPVCSSRNLGGLSGRVADVLLNGGRALMPENDNATRLLDKAADLITEVSVSAFEQQALKALQEPLEEWADIKRDWPVILEELETLAGRSPGREAALFKFCLFEALRRRSPKSCPPTNNVIADTDHSADCALLFRTLTQIVARPRDQALIEVAKNLYNEAHSRRPKSLILPFNMGRILWALGDRPAAVEALRQAVENAHDGIFDPRRDDIWLHLFKGTNEMMPYDDYFVGNSVDLSRGRMNAPNGRAVIAATARTYLALNALQDSDLERGLAYLGEALSDFPDHWPAAKLRCKTLYAMTEGGVLSDWDEVIASFDRAVELYPPVISELLPFGISAELVRGDEDGAGEIAKTWAYFATRVTWEHADDHPIPDATWKCVRALFDRLPDHLQSALRDRYPDQL